MRCLALLTRRWGLPFSGNVYADLVTAMHDTITQPQTDKPSMRRTLLTLLAASAAFGIMTASYATAELPEQAIAMERIQR